MKIIVDTNIVFSAILSSRGKIGELLLNKPSQLQYLSSKFLLDELIFHTSKIITLTGLSEIEYQQVKSYVIQNIEFTDNEVISPQNWEKSYQILKGVDEKDMAFVALAMQVDGFLWTGDKKLIKALQYHKFNNVLTTDLIYKQYTGL